MKVRLIKSWQTQLADTIAAPYFDRLTQFVRQEYQKFRCFPAGRLIFNALDSCPFEDVSVVILGQDPYQVLVGNKKNEFASRFHFFVSIFSKRDLERRYLTFVAKAFSIVRREGVL